MAVDRVADTASEALASLHAPRQLQGSETVQLNGSLFAVWRPERARRELDYLDRMRAGELGLWFATVVFTFLTVGGLILLLMLSLACLIFFGFAVPLGYLMWRPEYQRSDPFEGVYDAPGDLPQFAVSVRLRAGCLDYGTDMGVVSFSEGWLHFQGQRTEFHLARDSTDRNSRQGMFSSTNNMTLHLHDGAVDATVRFVPVTRTGSAAVKYPEALIHAWDLWRMSRREGRSLFPPCQPSDLAIRNALRKAVSHKLALGTAVAIALPLFLLSELEFDAPLSVAVIGGLFLLFVGAAQTSAAVRALRRLQIESPSLALVKQLNRRVRWAPFVRS